MGKNSGRSTTGEAAVPYYVESAPREAAKHLRLTATRFLAERATAGDVDEAIRMWDGATNRATPTALRPMSSAPTTGPVVDVLVATTNRAGCNGWLIAHYADGGGEDQPRFRGWFFWTGYEFQQIDSATLLGWLPLPVAPRTARGAKP